MVHGILRILLDELNRILGIWTHVDGRSEEGEGVAEVLGAPAHLLPVILTFVTVDVRVQERQLIGGPAVLPEARHFS